MLTLDDAVSAYQRLSSWKITPAKSVGRVASSATRSGDGKAVENAEYPLLVERFSGGGFPIIEIEQEPQSVGGICWRRAQMTGGSPWSSRDDRGACVGDHP